MRLSNDPYLGMNAQGALMAISNATGEEKVNIQFPATRRGAFPGNGRWPGPLPEHLECAQASVQQPRCLVCGMAELYIMGGMLKKCSACRSPQGYCSVDCQRRDWKVLGHKAACTKA